MQEFEYPILYMDGMENQVGNALSGKNMNVHKIFSHIIKPLLSTTTIMVSEDTLKELGNAYQNGLAFSQIVEHQEEPYKRMGKRLYFENRLCIGQRKMRKTILHDNRCSLQGRRRSYLKKILYYSQKSIFGKQWKATKKIYIYLNVENVKRQNQWTKPCKDCYRDFYLWHENGKWYPSTLYLVP